MHFQKFDLIDIHRPWQTTIKEHIIFNGRGTKSMIGHIVEFMSRPGNDPCFFLSFVYQKLRLTRLSANSTTFPVTR